MPLSYDCSCSGLQAAEQKQLDYRLCQITRQLQAHLLAHLQLLHTNCYRRFVFEHASPRPPCVLPQPLSYTHSCGCVPYPKLLAHMQVLPSLSISCSLEPDTSSLHGLQLVLQVRCHRSTVTHAFESQPLMHTDF